MGTSFNEHSYTNWPGEERRNPVMYMPSYWIRKSLAVTISQAFDLGVTEKTVLIDIGCGQKPFYPLVAGRLKTYIGVDLARRFPVDVVSFGEHLPLCSACADVIVSFQVLEHMQDPPAVLREMFRVLHRDGNVILSVPCIYVYHPTPGDYWRWTPAGFQLLLEQHGFEILEMWANGGLITAISVPMLIQVGSLAGKLSRRKVLRPLASLLRGSILISNWLIHLVEQMFPRFSDLKTYNSLPANILVLARKRIV